MNNKKYLLERRLARLEESLSKEQARTTRVMNNIGWGTGMRCTKCTPSFRREDELKEKIRNVKTELSNLESK
jgi:CRISPR/Cas system CSM-associated protein Csm5 (group 7 of RAMP superfamily)